MSYICFVTIACDLNDHGNHFSFWQFYHYTRADYKECVIEKNFRPPMDKSLSTRIQELIKEMWGEDPKKRPLFDKIALSLKAEYQDQAMDSSDHDVGDSTRSQRLMHQSTRSFRASLSKRKQ